MWWKKHIVQHVCVNGEFRRKLETIKKESSKNVTNNNTHNVREEGLILCTYQQTRHKKSRLVDELEMGLVEVFKLNHKGNII